MCILCVCLAGSLIYLTYAHFPLNHCSILLHNGTTLKTTIPKSPIFPDIEKLFMISGEEVKTLTIEHTQIESIDKLRHLTEVESITIAFNKRLSKLRCCTFERNTKVRYLNLEGNALDFIHRKAFDGLFHKKNVYNQLFLGSNQIQHLPAFESNRLTFLKIDHNPIKDVFTDSFSNLTHLEKLSFQNTDINNIPDGAFGHSPSLHTLDLSGNVNLRWIHDDAFMKKNNMRELYLSDTALNQIPFKGLDKLHTLKLQQMHNLWQLPQGLLSIPTLKTVRVSDNQRFLCCAFEVKQVRVGTFLENNRPSETTPCDVTLGVSTVDDALSGRVRRGSDVTATPVHTEPVIDNFFPDFGGGKFIKKKVTYPTGKPICVNSTSDFHYNKLSVVECLPRPNALRPCDDIMGNVFLTALSWVVSIIALLGNSIVFCVLMRSQQTMSVTKFLLMHLSFADLCLSLYLFILVSASAHTHGNYYNYVKQWQYGGGCAISGFLAVFSSQLSMLVLIVITTERYFAIVYAMHFHRRLKMYHAKISMMICWLFSIVMAILPILGVNSYEEVAICLPFRTSTPSSLAYICILLVMNLFFFTFVLLSYIRMYWVVRSPHLDCATQQRNDSEVAKRMALLVFTDFFCWAPIAFVGLMSAFGDNTFLGINVKSSKYLLVIFFPINSLCNPFMYAVSTNTFRRDFFNLLIKCGICENSINAKVNETMFANRDSRSAHHTDPYSISRQSSCNSSRKSSLIPYILQKTKKPPQARPLLKSPSEDCTELSLYKTNGTEQRKLSYEKLEINIRKEAFNNAKETSLDL